MCPHSGGTYAASGAWVHHWIEGTAELPRLEGSDFTIREDDFC